MCPAVREIVPERYSASRAMPRLRDAQQAGWEVRDVDEIASQNGSDEYVRKGIEAAQDPMSTRRVHVKQIYLLAALDGLMP